MKTIKLLLVLLLLPTTWGQNTYNNFQNSNTALASGDWIPLWKTANSRNEKMSPANFLAGLMPTAANQVWGRSTGTGAPFAITLDTLNVFDASSGLSLRDDVKIDLSLQIGGEVDGVVLAKNFPDHLSLSAVASGNSFGFDMDTEDILRIYSQTSGADKVLFDLPVEVPVRAYVESTWNGSARPATEDAVRDKIESLVLGPGGGGWNIMGAWTNASDYSIGDHVTNIKGSFVASADHTAASLTEPGIGGDWTTVWQQVASRVVLPAGRVPFGDVDGQIASDSLLFYDPGTQTLTTQNFAADAVTADTLAVTSVTAAFTRAALDAISTTQGAILYRNATQWVALSPGTAGQVLQTQGAGANPQWASGGSGNVATDTIFDAKGDLVVGTGSNTAVRRPVGTNGQVLTADSAEADGVKWATPSAGGSDFANYDDKPQWKEGFMHAGGVPASSAFSGEFGLGRQVSGGTMNNPSGVTDAAGIAATDTGTGTTDYAWCRSGTDAILFGGGIYTYQQKVQIPTLRDGTNDFSCVAGFHDSITILPIDGVYFLYDNASANWQICCRANSTGTPVATATAVTAATWYKLKIVVNAAASSVSFYINGTEVSGSPITTNIPSGTNRHTGIRWGIVKSAGTSVRTFYTDYMLLDIDYN